MYLIQPGREMITVFLIVTVPTLFKNANDTSPEWLKTGTNVMKVSQSDVEILFS